MPAASGSGGDGSGGIAAASSSLIGFLSDLNQAELDRLYNDPWTCQAVLRALPPLARHYVLRLSVARGALPSALCLEWREKSREAGERHKEAFRRLSVLRLVSEVALPSVLSPSKSEPHWRLHPGFCAQLCAALSADSACSELSASAALGPDKNQPTAAQLAELGVSAWERLLAVLVAPPPSPVPLELGGFTLQALLERAELLRSSGGGWRQTQLGRSFLLRPAHTQVWRLVLAYVRLAAEAEAAVTSADAQPRRLEQSILSLVLRLGFLDVGVDYSVEALPKELWPVLADLSLFGLVYQRKHNSRRYYTTPLAACLLSDATGASTQAEGSLTNGCLVLETNFRFYAHSSSRLFAHVLSLFGELEYRLPRLTAGSLTRDSIQAAAASGLTPEEIISFLERNMHPRVLAVQTPALPETVVTQVHLWARERERLKCTPSSVYQQFLSLAHFDEAVQFARDAGIYLWHRRESGAEAGATSEALYKCALAVVSEGRQDARHRSMMQLFERQKAQIAT